MFYAISWGEALRRYRALTGMHQKVLAGRIGVSQGTLSKWEQSEKTPTGPGVEKLRTILHESCTLLEAKEVEAANDSETAVAMLSIDGRVIASSKVFQKAMEMAGIVGWSVRASEFGLGTVVEYELTPEKLAQAQCALEEEEKKGAGIGHTAPNGEDTTGPGDHH